MASNYQNDSRTYAPSVGSEDPTEILEDFSFVEAWVNSVSQLSFDNQQPPAIEEIENEVAEIGPPPSGIRLFTPFIIPLQAHRCSKRSTDNVLCATMAALQVVKMPQPNSVFASVFQPPSADHTTPTPLATPVLYPLGPGDSFGGANQPSQPTDAASLVIQRHMYWSIATSFLRMWDVTMDHLNLDGVDVVRDQYNRKRSRLAEPAIRAFVGDWPAGRGGNQDLILWYLVELGFHFRATFLPALERIWDTSAVGDLEETTDLLLAVQSIYRIAFDDHIYPMVAERNSNAGRSMSQFFKRGLHDVFLSHISNSRLYQRLGQAIYDYGTAAFQLKTPPGKTQMEQYVAREHESLALIKLMAKLHDIGFGGNVAQAAFMPALSALVQDFIDSHWMKVDWDTKKSVVPKLRSWINRGIIPFALRVLRSLLGGADKNAEYPLSQLAEFAIDRLGSSRVNVLLDLTSRWPDSKGAILDLKTYIASPEGRRHLTLQFKDTICRRVLHAGATTTEILDTYIQIIRTFTALDSRGILLDIVSRPIRRYLKERNDTARIIVSSFLAIANDENGVPIKHGPGISSEIAKEMERPINMTATAQYDHDLDWDNMNWLPEPIDAGPDFKKNYSDDATGHLLTLYEREEFIVALKNILGEHFINIGEDSHLERETHLIELFKHRLGEDKLQACDVMLHDMKESIRINDAIEARPGFQSAAAAYPRGRITLRSMILSSFFWPELRNDTFNLPEPVKLLQDEYEKGFEAQKAMRKLDWLPGVGRALIELQLEDRKVEEEVPTWAAVVIYAFDSPEDGEATNATVSRTIADLIQVLHMPEELVRNALAFWVGKRVLVESAEDRFIVLEKLPNETEQQGRQRATINTTSSGATATITAATAAAAAVMPNVDAVSAIKTTEELMAENADMYRQFVVGMLTNQGSLAMDRILMMLKMALPGGFPFGEAELTGLLEDMVQEGQLEVQGDVFGVRKT